MLPNISIERYEKIGNSSLAGAALYLLDKSSLELFKKVTETVEDIILSSVSDFEFNYIDALLIP
ncbi:MAG: ATP-binding protein [Lentisphaerae bacterium]|nr:ATP-binding protein [Lentisphaerota bacterium]MCP4103798.1 ATP-binding protein [Lentisphaerota bacterium]